MPAPRDRRLASAALLRLIAFARADGWVPVFSNGRLKRLCKPSLPPIHLGAPKALRSGSTATGHAGADDGRRTKVGQVRR